MSDGYGSPLRFDGLISRAKHTLRVHTGGHDMGDTAVDQWWADSEPAGVYDQQGLVNACDVTIPDGRLALIGYYHDLVEEHEWPSAERCRVVVAARRRDEYVHPRPDVQEFTIIAWPTTRAQPWWTNGNLDEDARVSLEYCYEVPVRPIRRRDKWDETNDKPYAHDDGRTFGQGGRSTGHRMLRRVDDPGHVMTPRSAQMTGDDTALRLAYRGT